MRLAVIPYRPDSADLFETLADEPWAVFLDSGLPQARGGRWDILTAAPYATLITRGGITEYRQGGRVERSDQDPLELLRTILPRAVLPAGLPFAGGAIGYFAYDLGRRWHRLPSLALDAEGLPEMAVGLYDWALVVDHQRHASWLVSADLQPMPEARWQDLYKRLSRRAPPAPRQAFHTRGSVVANLTPSAYRARFERIQAYIRAGDCYQVNLAMRYACPVAGDPWLAYRRLRSINPAPYSAYLGLPEVQVLSASPERFLRVRDGRVETRPIKGTRRRLADPLADRRQVQELQTSPKDRAENLMIVDLLRNDLGKVCRTGSVRVPRLFEVEGFATVHHLVSTVTGTLATGEDALSLLRAAFPGGSITGAPKLRAMQIIEALEPHRRGIYCGAIGYIGYDGAMDTNIAIRTLVWSEGTLRFWAGGGIVADSDAEAEYQECLDKAAAMLNLLAGHGA